MAGITVSIPTAWSARINEYLDKSLVYGAALTNRNYEGEISAAGNTVKILSISDVTVEDYDGSLTAAADLTDATATLTIDQKKAFNFKVEDTDERFSVLRLIDEGSKRAAYALADTLDQYIASFHASVSSSSPDNTYGDSTTPITVGGGTSEVAAYDVLLELTQLLDEANVPTSDRRVVLPAWFVRRLKKELGSKDSGLGDAIQQNGRVGMVDGLTVYQSNNVPNTSSAKYKIIAGAPVITMAQAIAKVETYRPEAAFATGVKGLWVYGATVTRPGALALATVSKGTL